MLRLSSSQVDSCFQLKKINCVYLNSLSRDHPPSSVCLFDSFLKAAVKNFCLCLFVAGVSAALFAEKERWCLHAKNIELSVLITTIKETQTFLCSEYKTLFSPHSQTEKLLSLVWPFLDKNKWEINANLAVRAFLMSPFTSKCDGVMGTKMFKFVSSKCSHWGGLLIIDGALCPFPLIWTLHLSSHVPLEWLLDAVRETAPRFEYLSMILNFLLMWIHWFCHRYVSNFPFDPFHIKALKRSSKGFVTLARSAGDFLWQTHIFPNHPTFGLEITGQTNEFNELSDTQWMPLAIWTQIKGYGQVSRPFQGGLYTNVTESGRFSVCADKLFKVPRMSVTVPPFALPPFCSPFCVCCSFRRSPTSTKAESAKRFSRCYVCLISLSGERSVAGANKWETSL